MYIYMVKRKKIFLLGISYKPFLQHVFLSSKERFIKWNRSWGNKRNIVPVSNLTIILPGNTNLPTGFSETSNFPTILSWVPNLPSDIFWTTYFPTVLFRSPGFPTVLFRGSTVFLRAPIYLGGFPRNSVS